MIDWQQTTPGRTLCANYGRWYLSAAGISSLYWRALDCAIGAIYTAIPPLGFQYLVTAVTLIEPLTSIRWHDLQLLVATFRACDLRFRDYFTHLATSGIGHSFLADHSKSATDTANIKIIAA